MAVEKSRSSQVPFSSSSHRLPTVSASEALQQLRSVPPRIVATGLPRLDRIVAGARNAANESEDAVTGSGLKCGHIAEIYGPPGVGKTAFCLQAAVLALQAGHDVVWLDCGTPLALLRLKGLLQSVIGPVHDAECKQKLIEAATRFHHYAIQDLAHLLAFLLHPVPDRPNANTALIIVDSVSTVFETTYSRSRDDRSKKQSDTSKWVNSRKYAVMGDLVSQLEKLATLNKLVVLMTQQTRMHIRPGAGALLVPSLSSSEWEKGISTQLALFRDFPPRNNSQMSQSAQNAERWKRLRYVGVIKVNGILAEENGVYDTVVPFSIEAEGLLELPWSEASVAVPALSSPSRHPAKRSFSAIADSEDEGAESDDYGLFDDGLDGVDLVG